MQHSDRFLMDYYPSPLEGGPPLLPYARRPPRAPARGVPLAAPQRSRPPGTGSGTQGALCLQHGAPSCARCRSLGRGISRCCRAGHEGHVGSSGGSGCPIAPPWVAPVRQVLVPEARCAGAAAVSSWLGGARPASQALLDSGPSATRRCAAPPRVLCTRPSPALGPDASRPAKRQTRNRANRGDPGGVGHRTTGGGGNRPPITPASGGKQQTGANPLILSRQRGGHGPTGGGAAELLSPQPAGGGAMARGRSPPHPAPARGPRWRLRRGGAPLRHLTTPSRATPPVAPGFFQPHLSSPKRPRSAAATTPPPPPPRARRRPQPKATRSVGDMLRAPLPPPRATSGAVGVASSSNPMADVPPLPSPSQSTLPRRRQHGRASTEET